MPSQTQTPYLPNSAGTEAVVRVLKTFGGVTTKAEQRLCQTTISCPDRPPNVKTTPPFYLNGQKKQTVICTLGGRALCSHSDGITYFDQGCSIRNTIIKPGKVLMESAFSLNQFPILRAATNNFLIDRWSANKENFKHRKRHWYVKKNG